MTQNILITGAGGYIGGSVLTGLLTAKEGPFQNVKLFASVRSEKQAKDASIPGVEVFGLDLGDQEAVRKAILNNKIDTVVHTASSMVESYAKNLLEALGERRKVTGQDVYFIQTGVLTAFTDAGGWIYGQCKDSDPNIFEKEKGLGGVHPVRSTDILIVEKSKELGIKSFIIPVPVVYARGTGNWRKLSVLLPQYTRTAIRLKKVQKFPDEGAPAAAHIADLVSLYKILIAKILSGEAPPSNEHGYYFLFPHRIHWYAVLDRLAQALHARGLVDAPVADVWPSYDEAADELKLPRKFIRAMVASTGDIVGEKAFALGWQPEWDEEKFLASIDQELQDALDLDTGDFSVFDSLLKSGES